MVIGLDRCGPRGRTESRRGGWKFRSASNKGTARSLLHADERRVDAGLAELLLRAVGVFLAVERTDADAIDGAPGLVALGQSAFDAEHRELRALLLGILGARIRAGLHEIRERIGTRSGGQRRRRATGRGARAAGRRRRLGDAGGGAGRR